MLDGRRSASATALAFAMTLSGTTAEGLARPELLRDDRFWFAQRRITDDPAAMSVWKIEATRLIRAGMLSRRAAVFAAVGARNVVTEVRFKVARDGRLLGTAVAKSSGFPPADRAALDAVRQVGRFPPLPAKLPTLSVRVPLRFDND